MKHVSHRKPDPRLKAIKVYVGEEEEAALQSHVHLIDSNCSEFLRHLGMAAIAEYQANSTRHPVGDEGAYEGLGKAYRERCNTGIPAGRRGISDRYMVRRDPPCVRKSLPAASRGVSTVPRLRL